MWRYHAGGLRHNSLGEEDIWKRFILILGASRNEPLSLLTVSPTRPPDVQPVHYLVLLGDYDQFPTSFSLDAQEQILTSKVEWGSIRASRLASISRSVF